MPFECVVLKGLAYFSARPAEGRQLPIRILRELPWYPHAKYDIRDLKLNLARPCVNAGGKSRFLDDILVVS